jgi:hypothetical protein
LGALSTLALAVSSGRFIIAHSEFSLIDTHCTLQTQQWFLHFRVLVNPCVLWEVPKAKKGGNAIDIL